MEVIVSSAVAEDEPELAAARRPRPARAPPGRRAGRHRGLGRRHLRGGRARQDEHDRADRVRARSSAARSRRSWSAATCRSSAPTRASGGAGSSWPRPTSRTARWRACGRARPSCSTPSSTTTITSARWTTSTRSSATGSPSCRREGALVLHDSLDYPSPAELPPLRSRAGGGVARARRRPRRRGHALRARRLRAAPSCPLRSACRARTTRSTRRPRWRCSTGPGISPERAAAPLAAFRGASRRYERRGEVAGIRLVDDYAHHPSELAATLAAARGEAAPGRLLACFQPHMPWRTRMFADGFAEALRLADAACVCDVYVARGAADPEVTGELVVQSARRQDAGFPDRVDAGLRGRGRVGRAHRAARRPRADARSRARRRRARTGARAADMSAPPPGVEADAALARLTTIGTGGPARFLARPTSAPELAQVLAWAECRGARRGRDRPGLQPAGRRRGLRRRRAAPRGRARGDRDRGRERALRRRRFAGRGRAPLHGGGARRHRVRLRHPGHRGRRGAHERRRLRQRDPRRAALGRDRLGERRAQRRPARARSELPALQRARLGGRGRGRAAAGARRARRDPRARARNAAPAQREPAAQGAHVRVGLQESGRGPRRRRADRGLRAQGARDRRRLHLQRARELHRERAAEPARPTSRRWSRSPGAACASASTSIWSTKWSCSGPSPWPDPTHLGGRRRSGGAETGRVQLSAAVFLRRRAAAVVAAAVVCAPRAGAVELGYLWIKGSGVFQLRSVAVRGGTESERVAVRDAVARAAAGRSLLAISPARVAGDDRAGADDPPRQRRSRLPAHAAHPHRPGARRCARHGRGPLSQPRGRERPRAARLRPSQDAVPALPRIWPNARAPDPGRGDPRRRRRRPRSMRSPRARPISAPTSPT